jgi:hypothetical protein
MHAATLRWVHFILPSMTELLNPDRWIVIAATLVAVSLCVLLHYEALAGLTRLLRGMALRARRRILIMIPCIMAAHAAQIWVFGITYVLLLRNPVYGAIKSGAELNFFDYIYFSAMVFTTVGFGDLVPTGHIRLLAGMEGLTGLVFITWSASFAFLEMQRFWKV